MEIKRQIVESKFPPTNKEVWWFDLNEEVLKRNFNNSWIPVHTDNSEEVLDLSRIFYSDNAYVIASNIHIEEVRNPTDETIHYTSLSSYKILPLELEEEYRSAIVPDSLITITVPEGAVTFNNTSDSEVYSIVFPKGAYYINTGAAVCEIGPYAIAFGPNLISVDSGAIQSLSGLADSEESMSLVCFAKNPPVLAPDFIEGISLDQIQVVVPNKYVSAYRNAPVWNEMSIEGADFSNSETSVNYVRTKQMAGPINA